MDYYDIRCTGYILQYKLQLPFQFPQNFDYFYYCNLANKVFTELKKSAFQAMAMIVFMTLNLTHCHLDYIAPWTIFLKAGQEKLEEAVSISVQAIFRDLICRVSWLLILRLFKLSDETLILFTSTHDIIFV